MASLDLNPQQADLLLRLLAHEAIARRIRGESDADCKDLMRAITSNIFGVEHFVAPRLERPWLKDRTKW